MSSRSTEVLWVAFGQGVTALGTLAGVRLMTQLLEPADYGILSLALGMSVLAGNLIAGPLTQAAIHFYPRFSGPKLAELRASLGGCFRRFIPWVAAAAVAVGLYDTLRLHRSPWLVVLVLALFIVECWRVSGLSLLNAARRHGRYGLWMATDAWLRPLAAGVAIVIAGRSPWVALTAYLAAAAGLSFIWSRGVWPPAVGRASPRDPGLDSAMWAYAIPLIPLGLLAWISSLGDRYIIGGALGVAAAGLYAAVYGLAYSPFMIVNGAAEQALRPVYQTAVSHHNHAHADRLLRLWVSSVAAVCAVGVLLFAVGHGFIARYLVSPAYRHASWIMPWVALGYAIRAVSYVFERVCYAHGRTWRVLSIQICGAAVALTVTPIAVLGFGLKGAAAAVPVCFTLQCLVAVLLAWRTLIEAARLDAAPRRPMMGAAAP